MKKSIKFLLPKIAFLIILFAVNFSFGQTTTVTINYTSTGLSAGSTIDVPVVFNSTANVGQWQVVIYYNRDVLTFTSGDADAAWSGSGFPVVFNDSYVPTSGDAQYINKTCLKIGWASLANFTCNPRTAFTLHFTYNGGNTSLDVINKNPASTNQYSSYLKNPLNINTNVSWVNGSANGNLVDITSVAGGGNWSNISSWNLGHIPNSSNGNIIINSNTNSPLILDANITFTGNLSVNETKALTISSGKTLTLSGNFLIKSSASGSGSFINYGSYTASNTTVERYLPAWPSTASTQGWHMISSPVSGQSISGTFTPSPASSYDFFAWGESTLLWLDQKIPANGITTFQNGKGYLVSYQNAGTHNFSGNLFTSNVTPNFLTYTTTTVSTDNGVNLVGNPFTSALDASDINTANWPKTNVNSYVYVYDDASQNYLDWNGTAGNLPGGIIPAMQGFLICANGPSPSFTIPLTKRVHSSQNLYKSTINDLLKLSILSSNGYSDNATIYFSNDNNNSLDVNVDVPKQFGPGQESPNLYSYIGNQIYSTNAMGPLSSITIPLGFEPKINGTFVLRANELTSFNQSTTIYLQDLKTGIITDLLQNDTYVFTASTTDNVKRFNLLFNTTVGISENTSISNNIYSYGKDIFVNCGKANVKQIAIYNTIGQVVYTVNNPVGIFKHTLNGDNTTGYYIVRVITDKNVNSEKVFVK